MVYVGAYLYTQTQSYAQTYKRDFWRVLGLGFPKITVITRKSAKAIRALVHSKYTLTIGGP